MTSWEGGGVNNTNVKWTRVDKDTTRLEPCTHDEVDITITIYVVDSVCVPNDTGKLQFKWWPLM